MSMEEVNSIIEQRLNNLKAITDSGIEAYAGRFADRDSIKDIRNNFVEDREVRVAGRLVALRLHGRSLFGDIQAEEGKIQFYFKEEVVGKENFAFFARVDIGDILGVEGKVFKTRSGEITINGSQFIILSKSLRPLPEKWHGLRDIELRYRQRYLDLIANEEVKQIFLMRSRIVSLIRAFLDSRGYLEVETPIMQLLAGGAAGEPFKTYHKAFDTDFYLRLAPELYLKRLIVGGFEKVYEISKSFRNEGVSTRHNPEFTMLEAYTAYADYSDMMQLSEELIRDVAVKVLGKTELEFRGNKIDLTHWERISFAELMKENFDIAPDEKLEGWIEKLKKKGVKIEGKNISRSLVINIIGDILEPKVSNRPVFVTDLFTDLCPLAKAKKDNPQLSERFELFIGGMEVANAYSELNDPIEQRQRFQKQLEETREKGEYPNTLTGTSGHKREIDEDFILALEYGMPPTGGLGIGIDRLVMLFTNQSSIRDVILFPQLKPEK